MDRYYKSIAAGFLSLVAFVEAAPAATSNPVKVTGSQWLGNSQDSTNGGYVLRDGGWIGEIGGSPVQIFADGSICPNASAYQTGKGCGADFTANTIAAMSFDPTKVIDYHSPPQTFCSTAGTGQSDGSDRLHLANLIPTSNTTSSFWYMDLSNSNCNEIDGCPVALGVAQATFNNGHPSCQAMQGFWDASQEPMWGTAAAIGPLADGYIYLAGQLDGSAPGSQYNYVFTARVPQGSTLNYNAYQYWDGARWTSTRLRNPVLNGNAPAAAISNVPAYGSWFYSPFYKQYIVIATDKSTGNRIIAYTSMTPQGPYSSPVTLYQNSSFGGYYQPLYAAQALTPYDTSGKTLTFTASLFGKNGVSGVIKVTFG